MAYEGGEGVQLSGPTPESALLEVLRRKAQAPDLRFATAPERVTGGFWAEILAVRIEGGPSEINATVKAYLALKLAGDPPDSQHMLRARQRVQQLGGLERTNSFTRFYLALAGLIG